MKSIGLSKKELEEQIIDKIRNESRRTTATGIDLIPRAIADVIDENNKAILKSLDSHEFAEFLKSKLKN